MNFESSNSSHNQLKRAKKPKPLFGLFRKTPAGTTITSPTTINLGSGAAFLPLDSSILQSSNYTNLGDPYSPPLIQQPKPYIEQQRRQRSKSLGKDAYPSKLLEERELALNKLCKNEITPSLADSLPLLSPNSYKSNNSSSPPPMPKLANLKKSSSTHDLRKAAKLQQESINQLSEKAPLPLKTKNESLSRSKSLNSSPRRLKSSKSQQQLSSAFNDSNSPPPLPLNAQNIIKYNNRAYNDSDDDIPLGYLRSPTEFKNRPSSLLSDRDDDDDKDLIPIAIIKNSNQDSQSAADKYKERVKERLKINTSNDEDDDDDDIPISTLLSPKFNK